MNLTDPIADLLTRVRNAIMAEKDEVLVPHSKIKEDIVSIFKKEGYIIDFQVSEKDSMKNMIIKLKYELGEKRKKINAIEGLQRYSKPGRRVYHGVEEIPSVLGGLGICIVSTSKGLLTSKSCKQNNVGGEVLLKVW